MGIYHEYVGAKLAPKRLEPERKAQLKRIGEIRQCAVLTYAARLTATPVPLPLSVMYEDLLPFVDMLQGVDGKRIAVILETPGGSGEVGRQMVEILHDRFEYVEFVVPGMAKSTGTIMVLGGHEILMGPGSALGPIDAQLTQDGKTYSADALIEGLDRIKEEVEKSGTLNPAYIPILQRISPGEIQNALNALEFARETVTEWLVKYKFANWTHGKSSGKVITPEVREARAREISEALASQARWKTHGRSLRIQDLRALGLLVTDFTDDPALSEAIQRYHALLRLTFDSGNVFKLFETETATFARRFSAVVEGVPTGKPPGGAPQKAAQSVLLSVPCPKCKHTNEIQLDFEKGIPLKPGAKRFTDSGVVECQSCHESLDLRAARVETERQVGRPALTPQPKE